MYSQEIQKHCIYSQEVQKNKCTHKRYRSNKCTHKRGRSNERTCKKEKENSVLTWETEDVCIQLNIKTINEKNLKLVDFVAYAVIKPEMIILEQMNFQ